MKAMKYLILFSIFIIVNGCITQFIPETEETQELLVVEGLVTDQPGINTIKLSKSLPLGSRTNAIPLQGCTVWITDDSGSSYSLLQSAPGTYVTDPERFRGSIGRKYTLHVKTNNSYINNYSYESMPMELRPVPPIDSIYYEKVVTKPVDGYFQAEEGARIYLNTHDPSQLCKYFRWDFNETWEFRLPFPYPVNKVCWISDNASEIHVKSTSVLAEPIIKKYPLYFISNKSDRLNVKYSILVNQYSLNEDEFNYWDKLQGITQNVGSLYDITPAAIPSNIFCIEDPAVKVLGYFSVSAKSSKRMFIKDHFQGAINLYTECVTDTLPNSSNIPNLGTFTWILEDRPWPSIPAFTTVTTIKGCADCTVRGTNIQPDFWNNNNK
jgi:hypothetical protein